MGALPAAIDGIVAQGGRVTVHTNPDMFNERGVKLTSGAIIPVAKVPPPSEIEQHAATVVNNPDERLLLYGYFYYSGISGHCTGWRALNALANAFGDSVSESAVGTIYTFAADEPGYLARSQRP